jgi:hypothetical protein
MNNTRAKFNSRNEMFFRSHSSMEHTADGIVEKFNGGPNLAITAYLSGSVS